MKRIGIRELRQNASRYLREAEAGEVIEVTDRGRPVARIVPIPPAGTLGALRRAGRATTPTGSPADLGPPLPPRPGAPLPSAALEAARKDER